MGTIFFQSSIKFFDCGGTIVSKPSLQVTIFHSLMKTHISIITDRKLNHQDSLSFNLKWWTATEHISWIELE